MSKRTQTNPDLTTNGKPDQDDTATKDPPAPDPFDVERLRLPPDDDAALGVQELIVSIPYRTPSREQFVRVHPGDALRCTGGLIELKEDDTESFWVDRSLWPYLSEEPTFVKRQIVTAVTRQGAVFLWGLRLPPAEGKTPDWVSIPLEAAKAAETKWVKLFWDQPQRRHRIKVANGIDDEPQWPTQTLSELLRLAFKDRAITALDHPILKRLRGEV
jgi:hypothetical protein